VQDALAKLLAYRDLNVLEVACFSGSPYAKKLCFKEFSLAIPAEVSCRWKTIA
jgi:hypothetical protein